ncbi:MAG: murein hydrolase activator EnvC family protein [Anaerovoracaceae bacterium]|jgi:murein DD-endopeptidase MepM/ murein hydrolase activator NlpD
MGIRRGIAGILIMMLLVGVAGAGYGYADEGKKSKLNNLNSQISETRKQLKEGKNEEGKLTKEIQVLDKQIKSVEAEIKCLQDDICKTTIQINEKQRELDAKQEEIDQQSDEMGTRLRAMYKNGEVGMLEVLLGSESITDFLTNLDMVQKILNNDIEVLEEIEDQYNVIEECKKTLDILRGDLERKKAKEADKKCELAISRNSVAEARQQIAAENASLEKELDALNAEANALTAEILRLQNPNVAYSGGIMQWPCPASTRITSKFGYRIHPVTKTKKLHTGLDIGVPTGSSIVAANSGTVIKAAWNNSYGYMVMVDHGGGIVTLYAHNSRLLVSAGQKVERGQQIALSGNTGVSTGPHLHFEVRVNGEYKDPQAYL